MGGYMNGNSKPVLDPYGPRGGVVHNMLRKKNFRSSNGSIYLYIFLRNNSATILLGLLVCLSLLSFLRPLPSLSPLANIRETFQKQKSQDKKGEGSSPNPSNPPGTPPAHTGRQLTGTNTSADTGTGVGAAGLGESKSPGGTGTQQKQGEAIPAGKQQQQGGTGAATGAGTDASSTGKQATPSPSTKASPNLLIASNVGKADLLAILKRDPDSASVHEAVMQQRFRDSVPLFGFVHFSSYRLSPVQFAALGLSALVMRGSLRLGSCLWKEKHGGHRVHGNLTALYPGEHHDLKYETVIVLCHLEESTESDYGGILLYSIDGEDIIVYIEEKGEFASSALPRPPYKHQLVYCTPPLTGTVSPRRMYEWIEYHLHMGLDRLVLYDAGAVEQDVVALLESYSEQGISTQIINFRQVKGYQTWDSGRLLATNDCMYRHRYTAKWVYMAEMSEYFTSETGVTLLGLLNSHETRPYVSLGSRWWSTERCVAGEDGKTAAGASENGGGGGEGFISGSLDPGGWSWGVEKMLFHWPHYYCTNKKDFPKAELCVDYHGFRRYAVNPRLVSSGQIHRTEVPRLGGIDIDADLARLNRYPGMLEESAGKECTKVMKVTEVIDWWMKDHQVSLLAKEAKQQPHSRFKIRTGKTRQ